MNAKLFSEAMGEIGDTYIMEAVEDRRRQPFWGWRCSHRLAACLAAMVLALSFGTALAVNADLRQAVIRVLFPVYGEDQLHEIDEGHRTGSFSLEDTLFTFLERFNSEDMTDGVTVKKEDGFAYILLPGGEGTAQAVVECTDTAHRLLVIMERQAYEGTTGLWQVTAYQVLSGEAADELTGSSR